jgi:hypothetical protein
MLVVLLISGMMISSHFVASISYEPLVLPDGSFICARDGPTSVVSMTDVQIGIASDVPSSVRCAFICSGFSGCTSFNYRSAPNASSVDDELCELYTFTPVNCSLADHHCQYFQVSNDWPFIYALKNDKNYNTSMKQLWKIDRANNVVRKQVLKLNCPRGAVAILRMCFVINFSTASWFSKCYIML